MSAWSRRWRSHHLFDVRIDAVRMADVLAAVDEAIAARRRMLVGVVNAAKLVAMRRDAMLRRAVLGADLILADGMSVVWACRLLGRRLPERVTGIDLMTRMMERANERGYRVYCLGAEEAVLAEVTRRIRAEYPRAVLAGAHHGYYTIAQEPGVAADIAAARPDILLAAMSSPMKERFLARWAATLSVPVCHGVGGAFDVMAGRVERAPEAWQRFGMEWLHRALQEPRRLGRRYLDTNCVFLGMVVVEIGRAARRLLRGGGEWRFASSE